MEASELRYRRLFESAQDGILILDGKTGAIVDANPFLTDHIGYSRDELIGKMLWQIGAFVDIDAAKKAFDELERKGYIRYEDLQLRRKNGSLMDVEFISNAYDVDGVRVYQCNIRDITERRQLESATRVAEARFRALIENVVDLIVVLDSDGTIRYVSPSIRLIAGYEFSECIGRSFADFVEPSDRPAAMSLLETLTESSGDPVQYQMRQLHKSGATVDVEGLARYLPNEPGINGIVITLRDVTRRKREENELRESKQLIEGMLNAIPVRVFWKDNNLIYRGGNVPFARDAGFADPQQLIGKDDYQMGWHEQAELYRQDDREVIESGLAKILTEEPQTTPDGTIITLLTSKVPLRDEQGKINGVLGTYMDITEHKKQGIAFARTARALKALGAGNHALVHAKSEVQLYADMARAVVEAGGYRMAWVGLVEQGEGLPIRPVGVFGDDTGYVPTMQISWSDSELGGGPTGQCARSGQPVVSRDVDTDPVMAPWRGKELAAGFAATAAFPLKDDDRVFGTMTMYAEDKLAFDDEELALLAEMAEDLAYGVLNLRAGVLNAENLRQLERSMESTVAALASTVEIRDPYTAGHQRRVAEIAVKIGAMLELPEPQLQGLKFAATIHDIGKLSIPAEILSKPSTLTAIEYALIKGHAESGFEIVKDIDFPWPVAEIIRQHHERQDGSGYPRGLKGEQILLEAKILAVADVVESICSHRPYRPARGIGVALEEVAKGRGTLFDAEVADACCTLFRERGYQRYRTESSVRCRCQSCD